MNSCAQQKHDLERVAGLTADEAKELLITDRRRGANDSANLLKRLDAEARETAVDRAASTSPGDPALRAEHAIETTVSVVDLPSDDLKAASSAAKAATSASSRDRRRPIVDDTPGHHPLPARPYRREIAKQAIERLIADGRIHPARIEEVVEGQGETDEAMRKEGAAVAFELAHDLPSRDPPADGPAELCTSYGQNVLAHSAKLHGWRHHGARGRVDAHVAVRAAFVHASARSIAMEGTSPDGTTPAQARRERGRVTATGAHHGHRLAVAEAMIVQAADAIWRAPVAPASDILESYVKRLESSKGSPTRSPVPKSFALQAGRDPDHGGEREVLTRKRSGCQAESRAASKTSSNTRARSR